MFRLAVRITRPRQIAPLYRSASYFARVRHVTHQSWTSYHNVQASRVVVAKRYITMSPSWGNEYVVLKTPNFAESISEGDVKWQKGVGDSVQVDEDVAEIETDKTAIPVPSPVMGVIEELLVPDGETVVAGTELCKIKVTDKVDATPASKDTPPVATETPPVAPVPSKPVEQQATGTADVSGPPPVSMPSIPPLPTQPMGHAPAAPTPPTGPVKPVIGGTATKEEHRVKMSRMRQRIAERLKEAQNTNAMLTTFQEVDMSAVIEMRQKHKETFLKKHGVKLGFMSPFVKAACFALQDQPIINAVIDGSDIVYRDYMDISCAVATPKGLVVPVLRNVETMSFADIEKELNSLAAKAREGTLAIEEMEGGTFTVSNGGVYGSMFGTPIINPPQSAILGMHATTDRPVAINGKVEIRPMMYIALTYDHRLIDGREAVTFLKKIKSAVEDPRVILIDV